MDPLNPTPTGTQPTTGGADASLNPSDPNADLKIPTTGTSAAATELEKALNAALPADQQQTVKSVPDDHDHAPTTANFEKDIDLNNVDGARGLNVRSLVRETNFRDNLGAKGDVFDPKGGDNVVIAGGDSDIIRSTGGGFNTITTGTGKDTIILGKETTARITDFDPTNDRFVIAGGLSPKNITIAQGKNPGKGGVNQPLDSNNNALVIDKATGHILASLTFTKAADLSEKNFVRNSLEANQSLRGLEQLGFKTQRGSGKISGNNDVKDRLIGGEGNDFLFAGDNAFRFNTAKGGGGTEFPFPTDSGGTSELNLELKNGVLKANGTYKDFDGALLFSQGEREIDPKAKILNGSDPKALVEGFLKVPNDSEGNKLSGTHLHNSPANDRRGNFADATVIRYFKETVNDDGRSGTVSGEFKLSAEEQAFLLGGNLYVNLHTNFDLDGDGKAGFPTGENRVNINEDVVKFNV
jgi:hypothetical protein